MSRLAKIVLASGNLGKLAELRRLLAPLGLMVVNQSELGIAAAPEPYLSFIENALAKARHAAQASELAALADDSGICVNALAGAPGVHSARYAAIHGHGSGDAANNAYLVQTMRGQLDRSAYYYCVLVLVRSADDPQPIIADAVWRGEIVLEPRGLAGFGYDPHFWLPQLGCTVAQLSLERKNQLSHRAQALQLLVERLSALGLLGPNGPT